MTVNAPFRFARVNRWIHTPAWGPLVSHDVPFADGLSGSATVTVTAKTPLIVGGRRRKATPQQAGEVWPVRLPDGRYALPGATLQGLCRQILEIAAFGRLGARIVKRRFGIRDLGNSRTAQVHYKQRLTRTEGNTIHPQSKGGWLVKLEGKPHILPCDVSRIAFEHVVALRAAKGGFGVAEQDALRKALQKGENDAGDRTRAYLKGLDLTGLEAQFTVAPVQSHWHASISMNIRESLCTPAGEGGTPGTLVFTGKVGGQNPMGPRKKKREFVFHTPARAGVPAALASGRARPLAVDPTVWEAFHFMHSGEDGSGRKSPAWALWENEYAAGRPIPVFWWEEKGQVATFGMAMGFKAAWPLSTHDLLGHSHPDHLTPIAEAAPDLPSLIFGMAAEGDRGRGLKRRAWFGTGICDATRVTLLPTTEGVLAAPKPKYLGLYVRQRPATGNRIAQSPPPGKPSEYEEPLAGYGETSLKPAQLRPDPILRTTADKDRARDSLSRPELAGVKIWPAVGKEFPAGEPIELPPSPRLQGVAPQIGNQVKIRLNLLPAGTTFTVPLTFHNLRPAELGALLWALSFGDARAFGGQGAGARLRHRLGMGKPFNFGEVEIAVSALTLDDPPPDLAGKGAMDFVAAFEGHMRAAYAAAPGAPRDADWTGSPQVRSLLRAADPTRNGDVLQGHPKRQPAYMDVTGAGSYKANSDAGCFLAPYVEEGHELPKPPQGAAAAPASGRPAPGSVGAAATVGPGAGTTPARGHAEGLVPQRGARVEVKRGADRRFAGRAATIVGTPQGATNRFRLRFDDGTEAEFAATLFTVIAPPEAAT